jgi:hypothetical protein
LPSVTGGSQPPAINFTVNVIPINVSMPKQVKRPNPWRKMMIMMMMMMMIGKKGWIQRTLSVVVQCGGT